MCILDVDAQQIHLEYADVKKVLDGDTVLLHTGGESFSARLYGIDCMETSKIHRTYRQAYENKTSVENIIQQGNISKNILRDVLNKNKNKVYFKTMGVDKYARLLVILYDKNQEEINQHMIKYGFCSTYDFKNKF